MPIATSSFFSPRRIGVFAVATAVAAYAASFVVLMRLPGASAEEPLFLLGVLGIGFPLLAWALTRGRTLAGASRINAQSTSNPWPMLGYLALFAAIVLGWGFTALNEAVPEDPEQSAAQLALKLMTMVALPAWLFLRSKQWLSPAWPARRLWLVFIVMSLAYLAFQAVFGRGLMTLRELAPSAATLAWAIPACWVWQTLEAGLCEEVLFRRILQQRLADATGSQVAAITWASLLFGLAHAPGLWMRGASLLEGVAQPTPSWAVAYSIVMIAPAGIAFGVLWARTRSLWLIVPLHGMVDLLPQLAPFIRSWTQG